MNAALEELIIETNGLRKLYESIRTSRELTALQEFTPENTHIGRDIVSEAAQGFTSLAAAIFLPFIAWPPKHSRKGYWCDYCDLSGRRGAAPADFAG